MKNPDEIMADYLLKGGKMLAKECPVCGAPLFEYKGDTMCVVCREKGSEEAGEVQEGREAPEILLAAAGSPDLLRELERTIAVLCERARSEGRPDDCRTLMECIALGAEALSLLR
jgi:UPF0148 protein